MINSDFSRIELSADRCNTKWYSTLNSKRTRSHHLFDIIMYRWMIRRYIITYKEIIDPSVDYTKFLIELNSGTVLAVNICE